MMRDFILKALSNRDKFGYEKLTYTDLKKIEDVVMRALDIDNMNKLRDKFEGVAFIEKFTEKIVGIIVLEKKLKVNYINWETLNPIYFQPKIVVKNTEIDIITCAYGTFPIINRINNNPAIIFIKKDKRDIWICGFADRQVLNNNTSDKYLSGALMRERDDQTAFIGFTNLQSFETLQDLEGLIT